MINCEKRQTNDNNYMPKTFIIGTETVFCIIYIYIYKHQHVLRIQIMQNTGLASNI